MSASEKAANLYIPYRLVNVEDPKCIPHTVNPIQTMKSWECFVGALANISPVAGGGREGRGAVYCFSGFRRVRLSENVDHLSPNTVVKK